MNEARIKLAEAMGWVREQSIGRPPGNCWCPPNLQYRIWYNEPDLPDPYTDANDCEAVIKFLNNRNPGCAISIEHYADGHATIDVWTDNQLASDTWFGDDWKQGVCELALKVLDID